jgi:hypothetical protein
VLSVDDEFVYRTAEELRDTDRFFAQEVADLMLESDVGAVLESLHRLVDKRRLVHLESSNGVWRGGRRRGIRGFPVPARSRRGGGTVARLSCDNPMSDSRERGG